MRRVTLGGEIKDGEDTMEEASFSKIQMLWFPCQKKRQKVDSTQDICETKSESTATPGVFHQNVLIRNASDHGRTPIRSRKQKQLKNQLFKNVVLTSLHQVLNQTSKRSDSKPKAILSQTTFTRAENQQSFAR